jgi:Na+/H+ antiporter NhaD/arsenite permease-like protein
MLVANAGGALSPLGDPPLFLGFLQGVDFFWTMRFMLLPTLTVCGILLALFYALDSYWYRAAGEEKPPQLDPTPDSPLRIVGKINFVLLAGVVCAVLMSGVWKPGWGIDVSGARLEAQNILRDSLLLAIALVSLALTPRQAREGNDFNWGPIVEIAKLFFAIFVTIVPVIAMLREGREGALGAVVRLVARTGGEPDDAIYFWLTGALSAFLDNAPTYLVFFNLAGGDAAYLMQHAATLQAISAGAVFMGALTYIGNAPNFMVKAMAEDRGIAMPSFFGYMLWSCPILIPIFLSMTWLFY